MCLSILSKSLRLCTLCPSFPRWHMGFKIWGLPLADLLAGSDTSCLIFDLKHFRPMPTTCITHASSPSFASFSRAHLGNNQIALHHYLDGTKRHTYVQITCNFETQIPERPPVRVMKTGTCLQAKTLSSLVHKLWTIVRWSKRRIICGFWSKIIMLSFLWSLFLNYCR